MCSCLRGVSRWFTPLACGPGYPELSKSYMDMASKLFTFTYVLDTTPEHATNFAILLRRANAAGLAQPHVSGPAKQLRMRPCRLGSAMILCQGTILASQAQLQDQVSPLRTTKSHRYVQTLNGAMCGSELGTSGWAYSQIQIR